MMLMKFADGRVLLCPECGCRDIVPLPYRGFDCNPLMCKGCGHKFVMVLDESMPVPYEYRHYPRKEIGDARKETAEAQPVKGNSRRESSFRSEKHQPQYARAPEASLGSGRKTCPYR